MHFSARRLGLGPALLLLLVPAAPVVAHAQEVPRVVARDMSSCEFAATPSDSIDLGIVVRARPFDSSQKVPTEYLERVSRAVAARLRLPDTVDMKLYSSGIRKRTHGREKYAHLDLYGAVRGTIDRSGRVSWLESEVSALNEAVDIALAMAITAADSALAFAPLPGGLRGDTLEFRVDITGEDSTPVTAGWIEAARTRVAWWTDWRRAAHRLGTQGPRFPESMHQLGRTGRVVAQFVITPGGRVEPNTFEIVSTTDRAFTNAVLDAIPGLRFYPIEIAGCPVHTPAQMPFEFRLGSPPSSP